MKLWLREHRKSLIDPETFVRRGWMDARALALSEQIKAKLRFRIPARFAERLDQGDVALMRQFVPQVEELRSHPCEITDPIGDEAFAPVMGITHRYRDRVLLKPTYQCAVYCRFCFRREKVSHSGFELKGQELEQALAYIKTHEEIREVIFSGGDPLTLIDARLSELLAGLAQIKHVALIRFHTRVPTVLPSRITTELIRVLRSVPQTVWIAAHINSVSELDAEAQAAISRLVDAGIPLLHQGVLLKGVNDSTEALAELFWALIRLRVKPYYLHYPDLAQGTQHFRVPLSQAITLVQGLRGVLPGYAVPQLIVDIPRGGGKVVVEKSMAEEVSQDHWRFTSPITGEIHEVRYEDC